MYRTYPSSLYANDINLGSYFSVVLLDMVRNHLCIKQQKLQLKIAPVPVCGEWIHFAIKLAFASVLLFYTIPPVYCSTDFEATVDEML